MRALGIFPILVCIYAIYYLTEVWGEKFETMGYGALCVFLVIGLFSLLILQNSRSNATAQPKSKFSKDAVVIYLLLTVYCISLHFVGFAVSSVLIIAAILWLLEYRKPIPWVATTLGLSAVSYTILVHVMNVPMPSGVVFE